jgi:hypothetical protein
VSDWTWEYDPDSAHVEALIQRIADAVTDAAVARLRLVFALQQQARDLGRDIMSGGGTCGGSHWGGVIATYAPDRPRVARHDSWRCHHDHPGDLDAMECALAEVRRLAEGGAYEPCSNGPGCQEEWLCRQDWKRLAEQADAERRNAEYERYAYGDRGIRL